MTERDFCFWLQGFLELTPGAAPTVEQTQAIREHLALVFKKVTPPVGSSSGPQTGGTSGVAGQDVTVSCRQQTLQEMAEKIRRGDIHIGTRGPLVLC